MQLYDGDTFEHKGAEFTFRTEHDDSHGAPWEENDGHGVVSGWEYRDALRGEWVLSSDRRAKRFYNWAETLPIAIRDGWGLGPDDTAKLAAQLKRTPTRRDLAKAAMFKDFDYLRGWCNDQWSYIGVIVEMEGGADASLWGIESNAGDYLETVARELADEILGPMGDAKDEAAATGD